MKYLRSIELLRTVSKVLYKGQRNLARAEQLKTVRLLMSLVISDVKQTKEINQKLLIDLVQWLNLSKETLDNVCVLAGTDIKQEILNAFVNNDIDTVKALAAEFTDFDEKFFDSLLKSGDQSRGYLYLTSIGNDRSVEIDYVTTILKGVSNAIYCLCNMFWLEYSDKEIEVQEYNIDLLRYVCAMRNNIDIDAA